MRLGARLHVIDMAIVVDDGNNLAMLDDIDGTNYVVPTYSDTTCATQTLAVGNSVQCVGSIP